MAWSELALFQRASLHVLFARDGGTAQLWDALPALHLSSPVKQGNCGAGCSGVASTGVSKGGSLPGTTSPTQNFSPSGPMPPWPPSPR